MEEPESLPPEGSPEEPPPITPQRRQVSKRPEQDPGVPPAASDSLASVILVLSNLYNQVHGAEHGGAAAGNASNAERTQSVLQAKRLPRTGVAGDSGNAEPGEGVEASSGGAALGVMVPRGTRPPPRRKWGRMLAIWAGLAALPLLGLGAGWLWFRAHPITVQGVGKAHRAAPAEVRTPGETTVSDEALKFANLALDAVGRGELAKAAELFEEAQSRDLLLPGMSYQAALVALTQRDEEKLELWLQRSIDAHEAIPESLYLQANGDGAKADYKAAASTLEEAARNAAFSPRYFFFWAECLRRAGTPRLALPQYKQALRCRPTAADAELILFKTGLARIEAGGDEDFQKDLTAKLAQEPVTGDTLLLAAGNEINRAAYAAAADFLRRASQAMPPGVLKSRLRDYLFRGQAEQPDIAPVWAAAMGSNAPGAAPPNGRRALVDPATRGLADADPAAW